MKLEKSITTVVIGFQSADDCISSNQFIFKERESKKNFVSGDKMTLAGYVLDHFTPPGSTVLDMSGDPAGTKHYVCKCCML